jgi:hypothetical protein
MRFPLLAQAPSASNKSLASEVSSRGHAFNTSLQRRLATAFAPDVAATANDKEEIYESL